MKEKKKWKRKKIWSHLSLVEREILPLWTNVFPSEINTGRIKSADNNNKKKKVGVILRSRQNKCASYFDSPAGGRHHSIQTGRTDNVPLPCGTGTWGTSRSPCHRLLGLLCQCCCDTGKADTTPQLPMDCQRILRHSRHIWNLSPDKTKHKMFSLLTKSFPVHRHSCLETADRGSASSPLRDLQSPGWSHPKGKE